jgi:hypothetical protein
MDASIRFEDQLSGISNCLKWNVQMLVVLKENKIWNYVSSVVVVPTTYPVALDFHEVKVAKAERIILDGVKDHLYPHLDDKKISKEM